MPRTKVLLVNDYLEQGGIESLLVDFISFSKTKEEVVEVSLLLKDKKGDLINLSQQNVNHNVIKRKGIIDFSYIISLRRFLREGSFDIIHSHTPISGFYLLIGKINLKIPMIQTIHGFWDRRSPSGKFHIMHFMLTYLLTIFCKKTIVVSNFLKEEYAKYYFPKKKLLVIHNGINFTRLNKYSEQRGMNDKKVHFGMVGNFNNTRAHEILIKGFKNICKRYPNVILELAGDGELIEYNKKLAAELLESDEIIFMGQCNDIPGFLNRLDCFVYSSRNDSFGIAVVEAMYFGVPVIVSDNGCFVELTHNGEYATLFKCEDSTDLEHKIEDYLSDNSFHKLKAQKAKQHVIQNFSIENNFNQTIELYNEILKK